MRETSDQASIVLSEMKDAVDRASLVIGDLLDFAGQNTLQIVQAPINALIEKTLRFVKHDLTTGKVKAVKRLADDLPDCLVDANRIVQVFINLFMNASHAMPKGGVLTISTSKMRMDADDADYHASSWSEPRYRAGDTVVNVEIKDSGTGIPEEHTEEDFRTFLHHETRRERHGARSAGDQANRRYAPRRAQDPQCKRRRGGGDHHVYPASHRQLKLRACKRRLNSAAGGTRRRVG